jgi:hypothetical protein
MSTPEAATTSNPAQEEYTLFAPGEGRKEKEGHNVHGNNFSNIYFRTSMYPYLFIW